MPIDPTTDAEPIDPRWIRVVAITDCAASAWRDQRVFINKQILGTNYIVGVAICTAAALGCVDADPWGLGVDAATPDNSLVVGVGKSIVAADMQLIKAFA